MLYFFHTAIQKCLSLHSFSSISPTLLRLSVGCALTQSAIAGLAPRRPGFDSRLYHRRFCDGWSGPVAGFFSPVLRLSPVLTLQQYFILMFTYMLYLPAGKMDETCELPKKRCTVYKYLVQTSQRTHWVSFTKTSRLQSRTQTNVLL